MCSFLNVLYNYGTDLIFFITTVIVTAGNFEP